MSIFFCDKPTLSKKNCPLERGLSLLVSIKHKIFRHFFSNWTDCNKNKCFVYVYYFNKTFICYHFKHSRSINFPNTYVFVGIPRFFYHKIKVLSLLIWFNPPSNCILRIVPRRYFCYGFICLMFQSQFLLCCLNLMYTFSYFS